jgi:hypothetical protein
MIAAAAGPAGGAGDRGGTGGGHATAQRAGGGADRREASPVPRVDSGYDRSHRQ